MRPDFGDTTHGSEGGALTAQLPFPPPHFLPPFSCFLRRVVAVSPGPASLSTLSGHMGSPNGFLMNTGTSETNFGRKKQPQPLLRSR